MSFREKSAWVTLSSILVVSILYFLHVPSPFGNPPEPWIFHATAACLIAIIVIEITAHIILYLQNPKDAQAPKDERERLIELKATAIAAYVYVVGTFMAVATVHAGAHGITVGYGILLAFVIAEVVNYAMRIYYYRRGV
jgi:predicted exporter